MDAPHPLFQPIRVPRDVVIEENIAALEVNAFASRLGGYEDLNCTLTELLFGVQPSAYIIA
jgi:hypothetical protein